MAHIDAKYISKSEATNMPSDIAWRLKYAEDAAYRFRNHISVIDASTKGTTMADIDRYIDLWKTNMVEKKGYSEDVCLMVCIDWIEKILNNGLQGYTRNMSNADAIKLKAEYIGEQARRHKTINWTATQGTRDATKREVLRIEHTANAIHVHDPLDLSIGLATIVPSDINEDNTQVTDAPCDRTLNASFLKCREAPVAGNVVPIYQGATLKFWGNKPQYQAADKLAKACKMDELYSLMGRTTTGTIHNDKPPTVGGVS